MSVMFVGFVVLLHIYGKLTAVPDAVDEDPIMPETPGAEGASLPAGRAAALPLPAAPADGRAAASEAAGVPDRLVPVFSPSRPMQKHIIEQ